MKYCAECGQQLTDIAAFCTQCGIAVITTGVGAGPAPAPAAPSPTPVAAEPAPAVALTAPAPAVPTPTPAPAAPAPTTAATAPAPPAPNPAFVTYTLAPTKAMMAASGGGAFDTPLLSETRPRKRHPWLWITSGLLLFLIIGGALAYFMGNFSNPVTPKLAPADTEMFLCVKPNMLQEGNFNKLKDIYMAIPEVKDAVEKFQKQMSDENNLDYDKDIDPWLGKEGAFFMPNLDKENVVVAIEFNNSSKVKAFLEKVAKDQDTHAESYNGIDITTNDQNFSAALVENFLVMSTDKTDLHQVIDRSKGKIKDSLESNAQYQRVLGGLPLTKSGYLYFDLHQLLSGKNQGEAGNISGLADIQDLSSKMQFLQGAGAALTLESNGVRGDYVLTYDKSGVPDYLKNANKGKEELQSALEMMPVESLGFLHSDTLVQIIKESLENSGSSSELAQVNQSIDEMNKATGINLQSDLLDILRGDATLVVTPHYGDFFGQTDVPLGMVIALGVQDQQAAARNTDKILNKFEEQNFKVDKKTVNGNQAYNISQGYGSDSLSLGLGNNLLILTSSPELNNIVLTKHNSNLGQNSDYRKSTDVFPGSWEPILYVNAVKASAMLSEKLTGSAQDQYNNQVEPWTRPLKSISAASSPWDESRAISQGAFFFRIEKP